MQASSDAVPHPAHDLRGLDHDDVEGTFPFRLMAAVGAVSVFSAGVAWFMFGNMLASFVALTLASPISLVAMLVFSGLAEARGKVEVAPASARAATELGKWAQDAVSERLVAAELRKWDADSREEAEDVAALRSTEKVGKTG
jgi:hypothetical protein